MVYNPMNTLTKAVNMPYNPKDPNNPKLTNMPYNPNDPSQRATVQNFSTGGANVADQIAKLQALKDSNSKSWFGADQATQQKLHNDNQGITDQIAGLTGTNKSYDTNSGTYNYTVNPQAYGQQQAPVAPKYDYSQQIQAIYDQQKASRLAALKAQRDKALGDLNLEEQKLAPQYQSLKNQADVGHNAAVAKLKELMANAGLTSSGENITGSVSLMADRENAINGLNLQEQQLHNNFANRRADLSNPAQEEALIAALESDRAKAMLDGNYRADDMNYRDNVFNHQLSQDAIGNSRADAQVYGSGIPYDDQQDLNTALNNKRDWQYADPQQKKMLELQNVQIYQRLGAKGYDISKINGSVGYDDALKNMGGFQRPTLAGKQFDRGILESDRNYGLNERQTIAGLTGIDPVTGQPTADQAYRNAQLAASAIRASSGGSRSGGNGSGGGSGGSGKTDKALTQAFISELSKYDTYEQAANDFNNYFDEMKAKGVDTDAVGKALRDRYVRTERSWIDNPDAASNLAGQQYQEKYGHSIWKDLVM